MNFEGFYKQSFQKVYRFFYYKSVDTSIIEDLTQESFIRFYKKYNQKQLDEVESIKIIYGIARNVYREWVRKSISEKTVSLIDNINYESDDEQESYEIEAFAEEESEFDKQLTEKMDSIKDCLNELNEKVRLVLQYRFMESKSRKEVAEILKISEKDVHTYQKRGIKYIKKILEKREKLSPSSHTL